MIDFIKSYYLYPFYFLIGLLILYWIAKLITLALLNGYYSAKADYLNKINKLLEKLKKETEVKK